MVITITTDHYDYRAADDIEDNDDKDEVSDEDTQQDHFDSTGMKISGRGLLFPLSPANLPYVTTLTA